MIFRIRDQMDRDTFFRLVRRYDDEDYENMEPETAYYMRVYDGKRRFNWSAGIFSQSWLILRGMYWIQGIYRIGSFILLWLLFVISDFEWGTLSLSTGTKGMYSADDKAIYFFLLLWVFLCIIRGFIANPLYFRYLVWMHKRGHVRSGVSYRMVGNFLWITFLFFLLERILLAKGLLEEPVVSLGLFLVSPVITVLLLKKIAQYTQSNPNSSRSRR